MRARRVAETSIAGLASRSRQRTARWFDRLDPRSSGVPAIPSRLARTPLDPGRFFPGVASPGTPALLARRIPEEAERTRALAERILEGRLDLLGHRELRLREPIDWHRDPLSGRRAPIRHWSRLDPLDADALGDVRVVRELNRHQWLLPLGQAYRLSGDERYAACFARRVDDWMQANPPGMGINWTSSLEVTLRLIAWCWALFLFRGSAALSSGLIDRILRGIAVHARHVSRFPSLHGSPGAHLTGEALGLFYVGAIFPELDPHRRWRDRGLRILGEQATGRILPDGVHDERCTGALLRTIDVCLHALILSGRNGLPAPPSLERGLGLMIDFLLVVRRPDGTIPRIGDDAGALLPLSPRRAGDAPAAFSIAAVLLRRADCAWAAGAPAADALWLLGPDALAVLDGLEPSPPPAPPSRLFPHGGFAVMRSGWGREGEHSIFDVGPLASPARGGRGHLGLLGVQCSVHAAAHTAGAGPLPSRAREERPGFAAATCAHSTIEIDGQPPDDRGAAARRRERPRVRLRLWEATPSSLMVEADHDAYRALPDPVVHRRRVLFVRSGFWVLVDDLEGRAQHEVRARFRFGPAELTLGPGPWARAGSSGDEGRLFVRTFAVTPLRLSKIEDGREPGEGRIDPDLAIPPTSHVLLAEARVRLPFRILTLIVPGAEREPPPGEASPLFGEGPRLEGIVLPDRGLMVDVGDREIALQPI